MRGAPEGSGAPLAPSPEDVPEESAVPPAAATPEPPPV
jgi:hypothetical protein